jgi:hypothetical protein
MVGLQASHLQCHVWKVADSNKVLLGQPNNEVSYTSQGNRSEMHLEEEGHNLPGYGHWHVANPLLSLALPFFCALQLHIDHATAIIDRVNCLYKYVSQH